MVGGDVDANVFFIFISALFALFALLALLALAALAALAALVPVPAVSRSHRSHVGVNVHLWGCAGIDVHACVRLRLGGDVGKRIKDKEGKVLGRSTAAAKVAITQGCVTRAAIPAPVILHEDTA